MTQAQHFDFLKMSRSLQTAIALLRHAGGLRGSEKGYLIDGLSDIEDLLQACQAKREAAAKGINGYKGAGSQPGRVR
jgi:hypothetical protein